MPLPTLPSILGIQEIGEKVVRATASVRFDDVSKDKGLIPADRSGIRLQSDIETDPDQCETPWKSYTNTWRLPRAEPDEDLIATKTYTRTYDQDTCSFIDTCEPAVLQGVSPLFSCDTSTAAWNLVSQVGVAPWDLTTVLDNCSDISGATAASLTNTRNYPQGWSTVSGDLDMSTLVIEVMHTLEPAWVEVDATSWMLVERTVTDDVYSLGSSYANDPSEITSETVTTETIIYPYRSENGTYASIEDAQENEPWEKGNLNKPVDLVGDFDTIKFHEGSWGGEIKITNNFGGKWRLEVTSEFESIDNSYNVVSSSATETTIIELGDEATILLSEVIINGGLDLLSVILSMNVTKVERDINGGEGEPEWEVAELPECNQILIKNRISYFQKVGGDDGIAVKETTTTTSTVRTLQPCSQGGGADHTATIEDVDLSTLYDKWGNGRDYTTTTTTTTTDAGTFFSDLATTVTTTKAVDDDYFLIEDENHTTTSIVPKKIGFSFGRFVANDL